MAERITPEIQAAPEILVAAGMPVAVKMLLVGMEMRPGAEMQAAVPRKSGADADGVIRRRR
jgi:hypothetical protein